jgi:hypothetical protein
MRALKTFVFVDSLGRIQDRFLGLAPPDTLRWALAREYPWLERAYAAAYSSTISNHQIRSDSGALDEVACATLVQHFISSTQARQNGGAGEWVELGPDETWEHASWVSSALLERLVSLSPTGSSIIDMGDLTPEQKTRAILARASPFVAIVDGNGSFKSLIDRQALLESLAAL